MEFLNKDEVKLIKYLNIYNGNKNLPCIIGWLNNIKTITSLFNNLKKYHNIKEFNTGKCNQDFVENFFSRMRERKNCKSIWMRTGLYDEFKKE